MMPVRKKTNSRTTRSPGPKGKATSVQLAGRIKRKRINETGVSSRIAGHVSARGRRAQAKKDAR